MFRKGICISLLIVFMVFFGVRADLARAQLLSISLPNLQGQAGQVVVANVSFANNGAASSANFDVVFDPNVADIANVGTDVTAGPALDGTAFTIIAQALGPGVVRVVVNPPLVIPQPIIPDGNIVTMSFTIDGAAQPNDQTGLDFAMVAFGDQNGMNIPVFETNDGSITVVDVPPGLINVTIEKQADTNRIDPGVPVLITYDIILQGEGDPGEQATEVLVTDALPDGAEFQPGESSPECEMLLGPPNTVECEVGTIQEGETRVLNIVISIIRDQGDDILNQAIVAFLNAFGEPVENTSNTFTIRVGGGGGDDGCSLASGPINGGNAFLTLLVTLIPALVIGIRRLKKNNQ